MRWRIFATLRQEVGAANLRRLFFEDLDEFPTDKLALGFGISQSREAHHESGFSVHMDKSDAIVFAKQAHHLFGFAQTHQAMIDEHTGQLIPDCLVNKDCGNG